MNEQATQETSHLTGHISPYNEQTLSPNITWGNEMPPKQENHIRIYSQNVNGLQLDSRGGKLSEICQEIKTMECDILAMCEHNTNTINAASKQILHETTRHAFEYSQSIISSSSIVNRTTHYKPGGTGIIATGNIAGRIIQKSTDANLGRWSTMVFTGKDSKKIVLISAYQVVQANIMHIGPTTAYAQQYALLQQQTQESNPCPRQHFLTDLDNLILSYHDHSIILTGDFNETLNTNNRGLSRIIAKHGLTDIMTYAHPELPPSIATYARGQRRIDYLFVSVDILPAISSCGYEPFGHRINSDHRGYYVDLQTDILFPSQRQNMSKFQLRGLRTDNPEKLRQYVQLKHNYLSQHNMTARINQVLTLSEEDKNAISCINGIDNDLLRASLFAEKSVRKKFRESKWSVELANARKIVNILKRVISIYRTRSDQRVQVTRLQEKLPSEYAIPTSYNECQAALRKQQSLVRQIVKSSTNIRYKELSDKADHLEATNPKCPAAKKLRQLLRAEQSATVFEHLRYIKEGPRSSEFNRVQVPADPTSKPTDNDITWVDITDPVLVEQHVMDHNQVHFQQAHGTPWTMEPLQSLAGESGNTLAIDSLLQGNFPTTIDQSMDMITTAVLRNMQAKTILDSIDPHITTESFKYRLNRWREKTSTSPSGLHLGHYRAMVRPTGLDQDTSAAIHMETMRADLLHFHVSLLNMCITHTHVIPRWTQVASVILEKDKGRPRIHRLRVIHIYEADYNLLLGYKWQEMVKSAVSKNIFSPHQNAAPAKTAILPVFMEEMKYELCRSTRFPLVLFDNDARACFDRMIPPMVSTCCRRLGLHRKLAALNVKTLNSTVYRLKRRSGMGEHSYQHNPPSSPIYGTGQGAGNSPANWSATSCLLFDTHAALSQGAHFSTPSNTYHTAIHMTGYVDDATSSTNGNDSTIPSLPYLLELAQQDAQNWYDLLWNSGGDLAHDKCSYHVIHYNFDNKGIATLTMDQGDTEELILFSYDRTTHTPIKRLQVTESHKTLGCYKAPDGEQVTAAEKLHGKCNHYATVLTSAHLQRSEALVFYQAIYLPSVTYSLPVSHFAHAQLDTIQRNSARQFYAKCGYNRNTSKIILHGPAHLGGANFHHLYTLQGSMQVELFIKQWRSPQLPSGRMLRIAVHWLQTHLGTGTSFLKDTHTPLVYSPSKWLASLREYLKYSSTTIEVNDSGVHPLQRTHDMHIMDIIIARGYFGPIHLRMINACRLYLNVCVLSDITTVSGKYIDWEFYHGNDPQQSLNTSNKLPIHQPRPGEEAWKWWRKSYRLWSKPSGALIQPLGSWLTWSQNLQRTWPSYRKNARLYIRQTQQPSKFLMYVLDQDCIAQRTSPTVTIDGPPKDAIPTRLIAHPRGWTTYQVHHLIPNTLPVIPALLHPSSPTAHKKFLTHGDTWERHFLSDMDFSTAHNMISTGFALNQHLEIATDGSHHRRTEQGAYGWVISAGFGEILATGRGRVLTYAGSSYRSELYALLSVVTCLHKISTFTETWFHTANIYTDSQSSIEKMASYDSATNVVCPEWDILAQLDSTLKLLIHNGSNINIEYIPAHQDDETPFEDLSYEAQLNVLADRQASAAYQDIKYSEAALCPLLPKEEVRLLHQGVLPITSKLRTTTRDIRTTTEYIPKLCERWGWNREIYRFIDWHNFAETRPKSTTWQTFHVPTWVKLCNRLLPIAYRQHRSDPTRLPSCPSCNHPLETDEHVYTCAAPSRAKWRGQLQDNLIAYLDHPYRQTSPQLTTLIVEGLIRSCQGLSLHSVQVPESYSQVWTEQVAIGFLNMFCGHISEQWRLLQHQHYITTKTATKKKNGDTWARGLIRFLHGQWRDLWKLRNEDQHGIDEQTRTDRQRAQLLRQIQALEVVRPNLPPAQQPVFDHQRAQVRPNSTVTFMTSWLSTWEPTFRQLATTHLTRSTDHTRPLTDFFPPRQPFQLVPVQGPREAPVLDPDTYPP